VPTEVGGLSGMASLASRTNQDAASGCVYKAIEVMGSRDSRFSSATADTQRMAGSPRSMMASL
jgi:hypothetical protein